MIVRVFCPECTANAVMLNRKTKSRRITVKTTMPTVRITDEGINIVQCNRGHKCIVVIDNVKFEILFDMAIWSISEENYRDAISSFTASLERFYEFYWNVVMAAHSVPIEQIKTSWSQASRQSERQLGMYITAYLQINKNSPKLLNPTSDIYLRNRVIHQGYIPTRAEAIQYGTKIRQLIEEALDNLRLQEPEMLLETYKRFCPSTPEKPMDKPYTGMTNSENTGRVNVLTIIDVRHPAKDPSDIRFGPLEDQLKRIQCEKEPHRLTLEYCKPR